MNCVVIEDDRVSQKVLEEHIKAQDFLDLVGICSDISELKEILAQKPVDLLVLDIGLPGMSGIDFLKTQVIKPRVIVVSGRHGHAVQAFELDVVDYIVKPVTAPRFRKAADKARLLYETFDNPNVEETSLFIKSDTRLIKINVARIVYLEAMGDYVRIISKEGKYTTLSTMKSMLEKLGKKDFIRVHKSYIVAKNRILKYDRNMVFTELGIIPVSRTYKDPLIKMLPTI